MLVYKYRSGNIDDLNAIERNQFWSSRPKELNDPCEAITDTKKIKKLLKTIGEKVGAESSDDFKLIEDNTDDVLSLDDKMGIYSLSITPLDELLWAHYANGHKGFCIEYDLELLTKNDDENHIHSFPVKYSKNPANIGYLDIILNNKNKLAQKFAFNKSEKWKYEKEYRIVTSKLGLNSYDYKSLKSIYFGLRISEVNKKQILNILKGRGINFFQIELEKNSYRFKATKLKDISNQKIDYLNHIPISITNGEKKEYEIFKTKIFNYSGIGEFKIILKVSPTEPELRWLIEYLKSQLFNDGKVLFFEFYTQKNQIDQLPWVSAKIKNDKLELEYN